MEKHYHMTNIFRIHPLVYIVTILTIFTGHFHDFVLINSLIIVHEIGHISIALYYHWNIKQIVLLPFGGLTIFQEYLNRPWKEEFIIALAGPIFQILFYHVIVMIHPCKPLFSFYHQILLLFNLLPMIPLDGSKILNLWFQRYISYQRSNRLILWISFLTFAGLFIFFIIDYNIIMLLILFFILIQMLKYTKEQKYHFHKFLLERYFYSFSFPKIKMIIGKDLELVKRDTKHYFIDKNIYYSEQELLKEKFEYYLLDH